MHSIYKKLPSCPHIVEFLGPGGVGKTTLFNKLTPTLGDEWRLNIVYSDVTLSKDWDYNLISLESEEPLSKKYKPVEKIYRLLLEKKINEYIKKQSLYYLPELIRYFAIRVQRDLWMLNRNGENHRYINDEGLFHYYLHEILHFMNDGRINLDDFSIIVQNRLIFNLIQTKEKIIRNLKIRSLENTGANNDDVSNFKIDEVESRIKSYLDSSSEIIQRIRSAGGQVVDIDIDMPSDMVVEEIKSYLEIV